MGDLNGRHKEWFGPTTTNRHGDGAIDFATVSGCDQFFVGTTHARGETLDLLMNVAVGAPIGNSYHTSLSAAFRWLRLYQTCVLLGKFSSNI